MEALWKKLREDT
jgi:hypothetical protein